MVQRVRKLAGLAILDADHKNLLKQAATKLEKAGNSDLAKELNSLLSINILGKTVLRQSEGKEVIQWLTKMYNEKKNTEKMDEKDFKDLEKAIDETQEITSKALKDARELTKEIRESNEHLKEVLKRSREFLPPKP